ncbi:NADH:flavin oxidoreductase [Chloroflexota bacterium]
MTKKLTTLFKPGRIGDLEIRNRIVMAPMGVGYSTESGQATDRLIAFYEARAKGGVGLISTGGAYVCGMGKNQWRHQGIWDDDHIPGLAKVADAIKVHGAAVFIQLIAPGADMYERPKALPHPSMGSPPAERSREEIDGLVELFVQAARRAAEAGFDGIEIHGAHGYIISQFLSPKTNARTDEYGSSPANRARLACQILISIKQRLGRDFPVIFRMNGDDYIDGGLTLDEAVQQAPPDSGSRGRCPQCLRLHLSRVPLADTHGHAGVRLLVPSGGCGEEGGRGSGHHRGQARRHGRS